MPQWSTPTPRHVPLTVLRTATLVGVILFVGSACTSAGSEGAAGAPTASESAALTPSAIELPCAETIGPEPDLPDSYTAIAQAVALPTADSADRALQTNHREGKRAPNYFAKTGLAVRAGVGFTIQVSEPPETAQIGWGSPADFGAAITTDGCGGDDWIVFAGGFRVDKPHCVEITVTTEGAKETAQVGVGAPCEGQQPPPEPTDP